MVSSPKSDHFSMNPALQMLRSRFGYDQFRFQQQAIVDTLIEGGDALVLMPTGGGKSLCYQIPALVRQGVGIVISPLIALMQDQVEALAQNGVRAAFLNSTQTPEQQQQVRRELADGSLDLLYVAPERAITDDFLNLLQNCSLALFAIDEAHCVSQWGHDFRRDYQSLYRLHERFPQVPRIALTATADAQTRREIETQLQLQSAREFIHSFDRPNIFYQISEGANAKQRLWNFIQRQHAGDAGIVYCLSRKQVDNTADWLNEKGRTALPYHAGMDAESRARNQQRFLREDGIIIVATIAFGMGIDKPDVRFVAHLSLPKNIESYYQETGRAGRDGQPASAWLSYGLQDVITLRNMAFDSDANEAHKRNLHQKLEAMLGLCEQSHCRRQTLLGYFGETLDQPCGHCDNCRTPPETWDATEPARMALSAVYRTGQRFGVNYLIDVLLGKAHERIQRNGHDQQSTFGIGTFLSNSEWHSLFRQLIARGYLWSDIDNHGSLRLSERCRPLWKGDETLMLRKQHKEEKSTSPSQGSQRAKARSADQPLFDALRDFRRNLAEQQGLPPYVILHDRTLHEICRQRPTSAGKLELVPGIGAKKLELYGSDIIRIVAEHPLDERLDNDLSDTVNETIKLSSQGATPQQIAAERELTPDTIYNHLALAIAADMLELQKATGLGDAQIEEIRYAIDMARMQQPFSMKSVYQSLGEQYHYGLLNCVRASMPDD